MSKAFTKTYQDLEMLLGQSDTDQIMAAYRGRELYIPLFEKLSATSDILVLLGADVAKRLCRYYGNTTITVPMQTSKLVAERNQNIVKKHDAGEQAGALAAEYGLHVRTVRKIILKHKKDEHKKTFERMQMQLFDN